MEFPKGDCWNSPPGKSQSSPRDKGARESCRRMIISRNIEPILIEKCIRRR